jgi:16S rRNA (guanine527-N7)-methyltransferase
MTAAAFECGLAALDIGLDKDQVGRLERYLTLLQKWNRVYNLTAIRDPQRMVTHHLFDSLVVVPYIAGPRVLDVGSGAGFPGIPLAIARHDFLRQAVAELDLANVEVRAERVEGWRTNARFETVVSRAFAQLSEFVEKTRHLLASGGMLAAMKGAYPSEELASLPAGCRVRQVVKLEVPRLNAMRHLVLIEAIE